MSWLVVHVFGAAAWLVVDVVNGSVWVVVHVLVVVIVGRLVSGGHVSVGVVVVVEGFQCEKMSRAFEGTIAEIIVVIVISVTGEMIQRGRLMSLREGEGKEEAKGGQERDHDVNFVPAPKCLCVRKVKKFPFYSREGCE